MVRIEGGYSTPRETETMREAADEIERLRADRDWHRDQWDREPDHGQYTNPRR